MGWPCLCTTSYLAQVVGFEVSSTSLVEKSGCHGGHGRAIEGKAGATILGGWHMIDQHWMEWILESHGSKAPLSCHLPTCVGVAACMFVHGVEDRQDISIIAFWIGV
jgi:hypothetical protein